MLVKYAEALGSGLGILSGIRSWKRTQDLEDTYAFNAPDYLARIEDPEETDANSVWIAIGMAALRARVRKV